MKVIGVEKKLCTCCMEEHELKTVAVSESSTFKNRKVSYTAVYLYCENADELFMDEKEMRENDVSMKDAYRRAEGLLTSGEICAIRDKYGITQSDLCALLGWGAKTVTRYETHQVQDKAHDSILKKLDRDPDWFLTLLLEAKDALPEESYKKYYRKALRLYDADQDLYLRKAIEANYARFQGDPEAHGNTDLSLDKVVDVIRYFASSPRVASLFKVKLMKMMWYADALSYKLRGHAITGLVYRALPMGAVPEAHKYIICLKNVPCEEIDTGETNAYRFLLTGATDFPSLSADDIRLLDVVIKKLGKMTTDEIVTFMHTERAYVETTPRDVIPFKYAESLQI